MSSNLYTTKITALAYVSSNSVALQNVNALEFNMMYTV